MLGHFRKYLTARHDRQACIISAASDLAKIHGDRARYVAIDFARLTRDGKLFEEGKDAQFWWRVVIEIDKRSAQVRLDTATRYHEQK